MQKKDDLLVGPVFAEVKSEDEEDEAPGAKCGEASEDMSGSL